MTTMRQPDGKTTSLAVIDTDKPTEATPLKAFGPANIRQIFWIDNDRLAFTVRPQVDGEVRAIGAGLWAMPWPSTWRRKTDGLSRPHAARGPRLAIHRSAVAAPRSGDETASIDTAIPLCRHRKEAS